MSRIGDMFLQVQASTAKFDLACDTVKVQLEDYQIQLAQQVISAYGVPASVVGLESLLREGEFTMEVGMTRADPFDPFKVEAGCAHPDDYREPLPYHGAAPSADEWLCSGCGYWRKGSSFGVTPLPQPEPLTDRELDELLEKQAKTSVSDFRDAHMGRWYAEVGADLSLSESIAASFPIPYPRLPMVNAQASYNSIKALMHELEDRNRQKASILYSPDVSVNLAGSMITELRLMMHYNDKATPSQSIIDGLYTLESVSKRFVRSREQFFEAHPRTIYSLARELTLATRTPLVQPLSATLPLKMLGYDLREQPMYTPGVISLAHA